MVVPAISILGAVMAKRMWRSSIGAHIGSVGGDVLVFVLGVDKALCVVLYNILYKIHIFLGW